MIVLVIIGVFAAGVAAGVALHARTARPRERERRLEDELAAERQAFVAYRSQVQGHIDQTAHLFRDLTNQHAALYTHLAQAARELAPAADRIGGHAFGRALIDFASDPPPELTAPHPESAEPGESPSAAGEEHDSPGVETEAARERAERSSTPSAEPIPAPR